MTKPLTAPARTIETPVARVGNVDVSKYETPTGPRLRLRGVERGQTDAYLDPIELEGLTRARHKPFPLLQSAKAAPDESLAHADAGEQLERLQNEFAMVGVAVARSATGEGLLIRDMNAGLGILLTSQELEALLAVRHKDFAPLIDTSDLIALPEPDIDEV